MLKDLSLKPVYDSAENDLIRDLMIPLLQNSLFYTRGVGFFTSGWLRLAAMGLKELIENGGVAKIVTSPFLEKKDWDSLQLGEEARNNEELKSTLEANMSDIASSLETNTLNVLAWMIADELLEFKFAVARDYHSAADYHDKVGLFVDAQGNKVAIHGSFNDSIKGSLNGEAFSVFKSWEDGQRPYVMQHEKRLLELWETGNRQFKVYSIPESVREKFIKLRSTNHRPYNINKNNGNGSFATNKINCSNIKLYPYQTEAIQSWVSKDCKGIFEMATGTGKTITSLMAAVNRYKANGRIALVVLVPYIHLLEQWKKNCTQLGFNPILCSSAHMNWKIRLKSKIQDFNIKALDNICILTVHASAASAKFLDIAKMLKGKETMIIGDEVHSLGSPHLRKAMIPNIDMRLGLSATPQRWFDEEGSNAITSYFGPVCYEFPLEKAIGKYLSPYKYYPELVSLTHDEMENYENLTSKIVKLYSMRANIQNDGEEALKRLLLERARLIANAEDKLRRLIVILRDKVKCASEKDTELSHILVYCAPGSHKKVLRIVSDLGLRCHEFVHTVSLKERQLILNQFEKGDIQVIVAIKCLDEGVDVPSTRTAFFLASTSNPREFVQRRGRILRLSEGKLFAEIYDFIVIPRQEQTLLRRNIDASLLKSEMPRFAEFSSSALNEFDARAKVWDILNEYELLNLLDELPWELYHLLNKDN